MYIPRKDREVGYFSLVLTGVDNALQFCQTDKVLANWITFGKKWEKLLKVLLVKKVDPSSLVYRSRQDSEVGHFSLRFNWGHECKRHILWFYILRVLLELILVKMRETIEGFIG